MLVTGPHGLERPVAFAVDEEPSVVTAHVRRRWRSSIVRVVKARTPVSSSAPQPKVYNAACEDMTQRLGISPGFSISFAADGSAQTHGLRDVSAEDLVEQWIDDHPDDPRVEFALRWLEQRFVDVAEDQRVEDIRARREEFMKRWRE